MLSLACDISLVFLFYAVLRQSSFWLLNHVNQSMCAMLLTLGQTATSKYLLCKSHKFT